MQCHIPVKSLCLVFSQLIIYPDNKCHRPNIWDKCLTRPEMQNTRSVLYPTINPNLYVPHPK